MSYACKEFSVNVPNDERWELCPHTSIGDNAYVVYKEDDAYGPVLRHAMCEKCSDEYEVAMDEIEDMCSDCCEMFKPSLLTEWRSFDFSVSDGSAPYYLCGECLAAEPHRERVDRDKKYQEDMDDE